MTRVLWLACLGLVTASPLSAQEPKLRDNLKGHAYQVTAVAFSPDGKTLASASCDQTIKLWDMATGKSTATLDGHTNAVLAVAFSRDGKTLASADWNGTIKLWEMATGKNTATINGHKERVETVAFGPDGKTLASGSWDTMIKLWDVATGKNIATLGAIAPLSGPWHITLTARSWPPVGTTTRSGFGM